MTPGMLLALPVRLGLALLSFALFRTVRLGLRVLLLLHSLSRHRRTGWQLTSEEFLARPLVLALFMTEGPRLNVHAITATLGPFRLRRSLRVRAQRLAEAAVPGTLVIYRFPYRTVGALDVGEGAGEDWIETALPPGRYSLVVRYYPRGEGTRLPAVEVDGIPVAEVLAVGPDVNAFYGRLRERSNAFYHALQYHVYVALKYRGLFPEALVRRLFVPVGNPRTRFRFGLLPAGQRLRVRREATAGGAVFLAVYDRASFPVSWWTVAAPGTTRVGPFERDTFYLLRMVGLPPGSEDEALHVAVDE